MSQLTLKDFIKKYDGKAVDFDGYFGPQCMDLYRAYVKEVLGLPQSPPVPGAADVWTTYLPDYYTRLKNDPRAVPEPGDIVIWGRGAGPYGHIAVFVEGTASSFTSFDQNWPVGTLCHIQGHKYNNVLGWLRAKKIDIMDGMPAYLEPLLRDDIKLDISKPEGEVRARVGEIKNAINKYNEQEKRIKELEQKVAASAGEAAEYDERLRMAEESRDRFEKELKQVRDMVVTRDNDIAKLVAQVETLTKNMDPETSVIIPKEEYERLTKRRNLDKYTNFELLKEMYFRYKEKILPKGV